MHQEQHPTRQELQQIVETVKEQWEKVKADPRAYLEDLSERKILFAAGGGLPRLFGADNPVWDKALQESAEEVGVLEVAGVDFSLKELEQMGDFYRWLHNKGYYFHCIDERLHDDLANRDKEVHEHCGACAALTQALNFDGSIEDVLLSLLNQGDLGKQPLRPGMEATHDSLSILVDYAGSHVVKEEQRDEFQQKHALPFNVSIPLALIEEWAAEGSADAGSLLETLAKWNVQIARNIISGHNALNQAKEQMVVVKYVGEARANALYAAADQAVDSVPAGSPLGASLEIG
jgi:hypothetical protein